MKKVVFAVIVMIAAIRVNAQKLNTEQTIRVFEFVFGSNSTAAMLITEPDKEKAYFFLKELTKGSCKMSVAKALFDNAYQVRTNISEEVEKIVKDLIKDLYSDCYKGAAEGKFYESVKVTLWNNWVGAFKTRKEVGEW